MCPETKDFDSYWVRIPAGSVNPDPDGRYKIAPRKKGELMIPTSQQLNVISGLNYSKQPALSATCNMPL
jgi:hypothetical protein